MKNKIIICMFLLTVMVLPIAISADHGGTKESNLSQFYAIVNNNAKEVWQRFRNNNELNEILNGKLKGKALKAAASLQLEECKKIGLRLKNYTQEIYDVEQELRNTHDQSFVLNIIQEYLSELTSLQNKLNKLK